VSGESPDIRVSDHDREAVIEVLRRASGEGRITLDEFSEMAGAVFAARTRGELDAVTRSLPVPLDPLVPPPGANLPAGTPGAPGPATTRVGAGTTGTSRSIVAVMSGQRRQGRWRVAEQTTAFAFWGGIELDLRGAIIEGNEIEITAIAIMGGIDITVPEGIPVEMDGFVLMGGSDNRVRDMPVLPGAPLVRVKAYGMWGGVSVKSKPADREKRKDRAARRGRSHAAAPLPPAAPVPPIPPMPPPPPGVRVRPPPPPARPAASAPSAPSAQPAPSAPSAQPAASAVSAPSAPSAQPAAAAPSAQSASSAPPAAVPIDDRDIEAIADDVTAHPPDLTKQAAPDGTVTILFSDIESSAAFADKLGDHRWIELLREHNKLIRDQVARFNGSEVKSEGDGFMVAFGSARKAILCAMGIQQTLSMFRREHPDTQIQVRLGLHTGEVVRDDGDLFGRNVILAARVASEAKGGEILVSSVVKELTESGGDLVFDEGRDVELRGLNRTYRLYAVDWRA
jgi:class 3 adenylate cyclase